MSSGSPTLLVPGDCGNVCYPCEPPPSNCWLTCTVPNAIILENMPTAFLNANYTCSGGNGTYGVTYPGLPNCSDSVQSSAICDNTVGNQRSEIFFNTNLPDAGTGVYSVIVEVFWRFTDTGVVSQNSRIYRIDFPVIVCPSPGTYVVPFVSGTPPAGPNPPNPLSNPDVKVVIP